MPSALSRSNVGKNRVSSYKMEFGLNDDDFCYVCEYNTHVRTSMTMIRAKCVCVWFKRIQQKL